MDLFSIVLLACVAIAAFWIGSRVLNFIFYYLIFRGSLLYALPFLEKHGVHGLSTVEYYLTAFLITFAVSIIIESIVSRHPFTKYLIWAAMAYMVLTHFNIQYLIGTPPGAIVSSAKSVAVGVINSTHNDATQYMAGKNFLGIAFQEFMSYLHKILGLR